MIAVVDMLHVGVNQLRQLKLECSVPILSPISSCSIINPPFASDGRADKIPFGIKSRENFAHFG